MRQRHNREQNMAAKKQKHVLTVAAKADHLHRADAFDELELADVEMVLTEPSFVAVHSAVASGDRTLASINADGVDEHYLSEYEQDPVVCGVTKRVLDG